MPELPEVETIRRQLQKELAGAKITGVTVRFAKRLKPAAPAFIRLLSGRRILVVERRAKLLRFRLSGGMNLLVHLKMTGRLLLQDAAAVPTKHTHVVFSLSGGRALHFEDFRKFGYLLALTDEAADNFIADKKLGPEPLAKTFGVAAFLDCLRRRPQAKVKPWLMDQSCLVGVGNIYATEALWQAKIHPLTTLNRLSDASLRLLFRAIITILKKAIAARGTSADDYLDAHGRAGGYDKKLKVYGREGEPCPRCRTALKKIRVAGRGTTFCPGCQKP